jgi:hypothetical protein
MLLDDEGEITQTAAAKPAVDLMEALVFTLDDLAMSHSPQENLPISTLIPRAPAVTLTKPVHADPSASLFTLDDLAKWIPGRRKKLDSFIDGGACD